MAQAARHASVNLIYRHQSERVDCLNAFCSTVNWKDAGQRLESARFGKVQLAGDYEIQPLRTLAH